MTQNSPDIPVLFMARLEELYGRLEHQLHDIWLPEKDRIERSLRLASFKPFHSLAEYDSRGRAHEYSWRVSMKIGHDVFRVYFNDYSKKVYVDLNLTRAAAFLDQEEGVMQLASEIICSIMFTDPELLGEDEPVEVVVPPSL